MTDESAVRDAVRERFDAGAPVSMGARRIDRHRGCLLGGAIGDALGAPVEFMSRRQILQAFGPAGLVDFAPAYGMVGAITDDTQMTLFTAEGLLRAAVRCVGRGIGPVPLPVTDHAYARWMVTQGESAGYGHGDLAGGWLVGHRALHARRAPGLTCLSALREKRIAGEPATNDSKGCGGVMRVAPVGLFRAALATDPSHDAATFELACRIAGLTHGHPTGRLASGHLAVLVATLCAGRSWVEATARASCQLMADPHHGETSRLVAKALAAAAEAPSSPDRLATLGEGWVAEEALAIGLYCAASAVGSTPLDRAEIRDALLLSVNHDGDSDSTGSIAGNLLGAIVGASGLPVDWCERVELAAVIGEVAEDLATVSVWDIGASSDSAECGYWTGRYPGSRVSNAATPASPPPRRPAG